MNTLSLRCGRGRNSTNSERVNCCEKNHIHHAVPVLKHNYHVHMLASVTTVVMVMIKNPYRSHSKPEEREKGI